MGLGKKFTEEELKKRGYNPDGSIIGERVDLLHDSALDDLMPGIEEAGIETGESVLTITFNEFPTHIAKTNNKIKENKFTKVNNQSIYSGTLHFQQRAVVVENLKKYVEGQLPSLKEPIASSIKPLYKFYTVINHGDIKRVKGQIQWNPPKVDYSPNWDIQNLAFLWMKTIDDALQDKGIIKNDNVAYVKGGSYDFIEIENYEQRKIVVDLVKVV